MKLDPFLPVTKTPLFTPGGELSSRHSVILDPEGLNEEVGIVSADYVLVSNEKVHQIAQEALRATKLELEDGRVLFDGKRFSQNWILPEVSTEAEPGDVIQISVECFNSYNGSKHFGLAFNAQRLICTNGMVVDFLLGGFSFRHLGQQDFDVELKKAGDAILELANKVSMLAPIFSKMVNAPVDRFRLQKIYETLPLGKSLIAQSFLGIEADTEWGVYNAITDALTRQETLRAEDLNRQVSRYFMKGDA